MSDAFTASQDVARSFLQAYFAQGTVKYYLIKYCLECCQFLCQ